MKGEGRGRGLGYPTANLLPDDSDKIIPSKGVYAVLVDFEGATSAGMMNIGYRPTFEGATADELRLEVFLLDTDRDLYGKQVRVHFKERLRDEARFESGNALKAQLELDEQKTRSILLS